MSDKFQRTLYRAADHCKHCGLWHYGRSYIDQNNADADLQNAITICRNTRNILNLPDAEPINLNDVLCVHDTTGGVE